MVRLIALVERLGSKLIGPVVACLLIASCSIDSDAQRDVDAIQSDLPEHQIYKNKVLEDFGEDPDRAKKKYLEEWMAGSARRAQGTSPKSVVAWLAVAGALIKIDSPHYNEYYDYIMANINSENWEIAASAVTALSGAKGTRSIDEIIRLIPDHRSLVSADALSAIDYRLKTSFYDSSMKKEYQYAMMKMKDLCADATSIRGLDKVCLENEIDTEN